MDVPASSDITSLLVAWSEGDEAALAAVVPRVYEELHRLAHHYMRSEKSGVTIQTTALVHEARRRARRDAHLAGEHLLDSHRLEHDDDRDQAFYADVSRERELTHDAELYHPFAEADGRTDRRQRFGSCA